MFSKPVQQPSANPKDQQKTELAKRITEKLKKNRTYFFRPIAIDGILCYPVIYGGRHKIVNFESIHINCFVKKGDKKYKQKYSLFFQKYKTIIAALDLIEEVVKNYKVYNGDLVSKETYDLMKLEEAIVPYTEDQICCVCNDNTTDTTLCKHHICLQCREQCILNDQHNCPICRKEEIMNMYYNESNLINNNEYHILQYAIEYEEEKELRHIRRTPGVEEVEQHASSSDTDNEEEEDAAAQSSDHEPQDVEVVEITIDRTPTNFDMVMDIDPIDPPTTPVDANDVVMLSDINADNIRQRMYEVINHYSRMGFQQSRISTTMSYNMRNVTLTRGSDSYYPRSMSPELALEDGEINEMDIDNGATERYVV
jgi:hypothetical protein